MSKVLRTFLLLTFIVSSFGGAYLLFHDNNKRHEGGQSQALDAVEGFVELDPLSKSTEPALQRVASASGSMPSPSNLREVMRRDTDGLVECTHADGGTSVHLQGRYSHVTVALPDGSGGWIYRCFENHEELQAALNGSLPADNDNPTTDEVAYQ